MRATHIPQEDPVSKKILFVGAGAIGSYLGAFLSRAGHDVTLVDAVGRAGRDHQPPGHRGHRARTTRSTRDPTAVHLHEAPAAAARLRHRLRRHEGLRHGVGHPARAAATSSPRATSSRRRTAGPIRAWPPWPAPTARSGSSCRRSAWRCWKPGEVERGMEKGGSKGHDVFRAGEHDGRITPRAQELAEMLSVVDGSLATDNLWGERWSKLCANCHGQPRAGHVRARLAARSPAARSAAPSPSTSAAESARVGLALGYTIPKFNGATAEQWADAGRRETYEALDADAHAQDGVQRATGAPRWPRT